jgi:hypothetical protein
MPIGRCLDQYGGRSGVWSHELVGDFPGYLRVESFGGEWSVTYLNEEAGWMSGIAWSSEGIVIASDDPVVKCHYDLDGGLVAVKLGLTSLVNRFAEQGMDPHLVNQSDWSRLIDLADAGDEIKLVVFFGDDEFSPYWCLLRTKIGQESGEALEVQVIDRILMNLSAGNDEPLFVRPLGGFDLKFRLLIDEGEMCFGVVGEEDEVPDLVIRRNVDFTNLRNRIRFDREARWRDLNSALGQVSSALKLLP